MMVESFPLSKKSSVEEIFDGSFFRKEFKSKKYQTRADTHSHTHTHAQTHYTHTHTHMRKCIHTLTHTHPHAHANRYPGEMKEGEKK